MLSSYFGTVILVVQVFPVPVRFNSWYWELFLNKLIFNSSGLRFKAFELSNQFLVTVIVMFFFNVLVTVYSDWLYSTKPYSSNGVSSIRYVYLTPFSSYLGTVILSLSQVLVSPVKVTVW